MWFRRVLRSMSGGAGARDGDCGHLGGRSARGIDAVRARPAACSKPSPLVRARQVHAGFAARRFKESATRSLLDMQIYVG